MDKASSLLSERKHKQEWQIEREIHFKWSISLQTQNGNLVFIHEKNGGIKVTESAVWVF